MNAVAKIPEHGSIVEQVIVKGDLSKLTPDERTRYYVEVCKSVGLNPLTKPFEYITLNNKLTLYALRACTDQLRSIHSISVVDMSETERDGVFVVTAKVSNKDGRTDIAKGAVSISNLKGEALANALMKAETKAKRRATLSICGLGFLDETEVETIPGAKIGDPASPPRATLASPAPVDPPHNPETGEIGPHAIAMPSRDGKNNWIAWGGSLIAAFKASKDHTELMAWQDTNDASLTDCEKAAPKAYASIIGAFHKRAKELKETKAEVLPPDPMEPPAFLRRTPAPLVEDEEIPF
jgi:hypothetical protein